MRTACAQRFTRPYSRLRRRSLAKAEHLAGRLDDCQQTSSLCVFIPAHPRSFLGSIRSGDPLRADPAFQKLCEEKQGLTTNGH
jgi:hypothetical protein